MASSMEFIVSSNGTVAEVKVDSSSWNVVATPVKSTYCSARATFPGVNEEAIAPTEQTERIASTLDWDMAVRLAL